MAQKNRAVFGIYASADQAERAVNKLVDDGFVSQDVSVLMPDQRSTREFLVVLVPPLDVIDVAPASFEDFVGRRPHLATGHRAQVHDRDQGMRAVLDARRADGRRIGQDPGHGAVPFCAVLVKTEVVVVPGAGCAGLGSVVRTCVIVTRTAGLMMSSTGLG